uniref:L-lactate dehydrogenase n=1 Tax=Lotharella oceanica TaxID=641309 RepID=A0A7S2U466_9EUKA|mmetsp:Transcript_7381/g.14452  ORF Transcript_7381/g.14452 Transcript_7381/m.14452 type:complete len:374 (+) Transcript_7381:2-1123(+)
MASRWLRGLRRLPPPPSALRVSPSLSKEGKRTYGYLRNGHVSAVCGQGRGTILGGDQRRHVSNATTESPSSRAVIIGAGSVGSTIGSFLVFEGAYDEVVLIDLDEDRLRGEVMDLSDASFLSDTSVRMGTYEDAADADLVIITAGAKQRPNETRLALLKRNVGILSSIADSILPVADHTLVLLVANPVDILTQLFQEISQLPKERVIGSGTFLDSMRLCTELSRKFGVAPSHIHAYVVGMHGDCQIPVWSHCSVGGVHVSGYGCLKRAEMIELAERARDKAYRIINAKGSTYYGIAACVAKLSVGLQMNRHQIFPLSVWSEANGSYLSWPAFVGSNGVQGTLPLTLNSEESAVVERAAATVKAAVADAQKPGE